PFLQRPGRKKLHETRFLALSQGHLVCCGRREALTGPACSKRDSRPARSPSSPLRKDDAGVTASSLPASPTTEPTCSKDSTPTTGSRRRGSRHLSGLSDTPDICPRCGSRPMVPRLAAPRWRDCFSQKQSRRWRPGRPLLFLHGGVSGFARAVGQDL